MFVEFREQLATFIFPEFIERRDELDRAANTDALTGLANRAAFDKAEGKARRDGLAFIVFDLNNFKRVNDQIGHLAGDRVLSYYADVVANVAAKFKARAFRYGGDEFVIVCAHRFAPRVRDAVETRALIRDFGNFCVSISGCYGNSFADADAVLQARKAERKNAR